MMRFRMTYGTRVVAINIRGRTLEQATALAQTWGFRTDRPLMMGGYWQLSQAPLRAQVTTEVPLVAGRVWAEVIGTPAELKMLAAEAIYYAGEPDPLGRDLNDKADEETRA
jgi:hypothetical protein